MVRRALVTIAAVLVASAAQAEPTPLEQLVGRTDQVAREVSKVRGLPLRKKIPYEVVDRDALRERLLALASEDKTEAETMAEGLALARWGMIPLSIDYQALIIDLLTEQVAGYYDPATKKLTISTSAGDDPVWAEMVLAHEIDHALQDQTFDLHKFEAIPDGEDDALLARRALVEGDGIALMLEIMLKRNGSPAPWSNPMVADAIVKTMALPTGEGDGLDRAPLVIREAMVFPYRAGFSFIAALRRRQPWSAVDAAFARPPRSTEQIIHPERYFAGDHPVPIQIKPLASLRGFTQVHTTVWGELGFDLFLRSHGLDGARAAQAAAGWGGDRVIVLARLDDQRPERAVAIARTEWDTEVDAIEAAESAGWVLDRFVVGTTLDATPTRTRWMGIDGTVSWVERKGPSLVIVLGAPLWAADALGAEVWTASSVGPAPRAIKPKR
ncbi:MAG: hypothetical protein AB7O24_12520 [Kofleriaceae bacterium]